MRESATRRRHQRRSGGGGVSSGLTSSTGTYHGGILFFLKTSGEYRVVITPPAGYELAAKQSASAAITFVRDQTKTVNFVLRAV